MLWTGERVFATVSHVSYMFSFSQSARRYTRCDEVKLVELSGMALENFGVEIEEVLYHVDD